MTYPLQRYIKFSFRQNISAVLCRQTLFSEAVEDERKNVIY